MVTCQKASPIPTHMQQETLHALKMKCCTASRRPCVAITADYRTLAVSQLCDVYVECQHGAET